MAVYSMTGFGSATANAANVAGSANGNMPAEGSSAGDAGGVVEPGWSGSGNRLLQAIYKGA